MLNLKGWRRVWPCRRHGSSCECCGHVDCVVLATFHQASTYHCHSEHTGSAHHITQHHTHPQIPCMSRQLQN